MPAHSRGADSTASSAAGTRANPHFLAAGFGNVPLLHPQTAAGLRNDHGAHLRHDRIMVKAISDCYPERASRGLVFVRLLDGEAITGRASVRAQELLLWTTTRCIP